MNTNTTTLLAVGALVGIGIYLVKNQPKLREKVSQKLREYYDSLGSAGEPARALMRGAGYDV